MFDIGATELLLIVVVAVVVIGPKDLPLAMRTAGRWIGKLRRVSNHFRAGLDAMVREAEMEEMERKWREQNARIMREHPADATPDAAAAAALDRGFALPESSAPPPGALPAPPDLAPPTEQRPDEEAPLAQPAPAGGSDAESRSRPPAEALPGQDERP